jgi:ribosome-associated translation inhibitor RaiA
VKIYTDISNGITQAFDYVKSKQGRFIHESHVKKLEDKIKSIDCYVERDAKIVKLKEEKDKLTTQLVSYEATIGYLKDAIAEAIKAEDAHDMYHALEKALNGLKK